MLQPDGDMGHIDCNRTPPARRGCAGAWISTGLAVLCALFALGWPPAQAATEVDFIAAEKPEGYARIVLTFPKLPEYSIDVRSGVLVISFKEAMWARLDETTMQAPSYIVVGRVDPDGRAIRFALGRAVRVNTMEAAERLYIDLLPENWTGLPPSLPTAVVEELVRRAASAEEAAIREARRRALEQSEYRLRVRVGEHPTFSRIVFDWGSYVGVSVGRDEDTVTLSFDQFAVVPMDRLKSDPPRFVTDAETILSDDGVGVVLTIATGSNIRGFREENTYVLDVLAPAGVVGSDNSPVTLVAADEAGAGAEDYVAFNSETQDGAVEGAPAAVVPELPARVDAMDDADALDEAHAAAAAAPPSGNAIPDVLITRFDLNHNASGLAGEDDAEPVRADADGGGETPGDDSSEAVVAAAPPAPEAQASVEAPAASDMFSGADAEDVQTPPQAGPVIVRAEYDGRTLRVYFPFDRDVSSAVFRRSNVLWVVFDTDRDFDLAALRGEVRDTVRDVKLSRGAGVQVLRLYLREYALASTAQEAHTWVLSVGDTIVTPAAPVSLRRGLRTDGRAKVTVEFADAGAVHRLRDPEVGDEISVVTGFAPQRGFTRPQDFVEFTVLETAHGLAVRPLTDDLVLRLIEHKVLITRPAGLTLSAGRMSEIENTSQGNRESTRPGFIDYARWSFQGGEFVDRILTLETSIAEVEPSQTMGARFDLSRLFLANGLGSEALGQLELIGELDPEIVADAMFAAMRGIANVLMHRPEQARADLMSFSLADDPHAALWRGMMEAQLQNWTDAVQEFRAGLSVIGDYPPAEQVRFGLAASRATIETGDVAAAEVQLQSIADQRPTGAAGAELLVLQGRALAGQGRTIEALELLDAARTSGDLMAEAEAGYHHLLLAAQLGEVDRSEVLARLETLAVSWRGDDLELSTLRRLARYYVEDAQYRRALGVMKVAVKNYPRAAIARRISDEMAALFVDLFLDDKVASMRPIDALSLYYEYRELTPVGRRGDEMIRHLADRLIAVDLLDQAAAILSHQVDKRLIGAARAQVAAKLAMVYLMNHEPNQALQAIRRTRQAVLPQHIQTQRRIAEARALSELGRTDAAVELLANVDGTEALRERSEALWRGERWQAAAEGFERLLSAREGAATALSARDRIDVLRAAISYVLADDTIGIRRLRDAYGSAMRDTNEDSAFEAVTNGLDRDATAFRDLAREIASIDTLEQFLEDFRRHFDEPMIGADASPT